MASYSALSIAFSSSYMQIFKFNGKSIYNGNKFYNISHHPLRSAADPLSFQHMCTFSLKSTFTFHVARLNVYEMFHILTILKMCLKRNKNAHNDPYITIKKKNHSHTLSFCTHEEENELFMAYCECVRVRLCVSLRIVTISIVTLLLYFVLVSLILLCARQLWCYWNMYSVHFQPVPVLSICSLCCFRFNGFFLYGFW